MCRLFLRAVVLLPVLAFLGCADAPETPTSHAVGVDRPQWFRSALAGSERALRHVGCEKAPLEIVHTDDPLWKACLRETVEAAESARQRVYGEALRECVQWRGVQPECCFSRVSDDSAAEAAWRESCEEECRTKRPVGRRYSTAPKCNSEIVAYPLDVMRFRTPLVDNVLEGCASGLATETACEALPTLVERHYCVGACALERELFVRSLGQCVDAVNRGHPPLCEHLFADKPVVSPATEMKRKGDCERQCSEAVLPPLR